MMKLNFTPLLSVLFFLAFNVQVNAQCENTNIETTNGKTTVYTCPGDNIDDLIDLTNDGTGTTNYAYVATDLDNNILGIPSGNTFNFEGAGEGTCLIWGFSYTGDITAQVGDHLWSTPFSNGCFHISYNLVRVIREMPDGGTINANGGSNDITVCTTNQYPDDITYNRQTSSGAAYIYLITDADNNILATTTNQNFNFDGVPPGVCRIWGLSFTGNLTATIGNNAATTDLSDDCFDLSDNFIEVTRTDVDGGTVAMPSGATTRYTCTQDGNPDVVMFTHVSNSPSNYRYIITDDSGNVLGLPPGDSADFDGAPAGNCQVWGLSFTGDMTIWPGDNIFNKTLSTDCYGLSENFIEIIRDTPEGGTVETINGETSVTVTVGDGIDDEIFFQHAGNSNSNFTYVVTDDNNNIIGIPPGNSQNFEGAPAGTCRVWGLSYTGMITAQVGDNAATVNLTNDCFDLSDNFVEIIRLDGSTPCLVEGGVLTGGPFEFTVGDGNPDNIPTGSITLANSQGQNSQWVVTDDEGYILGLPPMPSVVDFDGAGAGNCLIWHLSFDDGLQGAAVGNNAMTDLAGCYSLSDAIEVVRVPLSPFNEGINNQLVGNTSTRIETTIFPNPTADFLNVHFDKNETLQGDNLIQIQNTLGQIVFSQNYDGEAIEGQTIQLNINHLENGNYYLTIRGKEKVMSEQFVKTSN